MRNKKVVILILTIGVFGILNTEMGFIGLIPYISNQFNVSVSMAGWVISAFAIGIAISGPIMPLLLSKIERKKVMIFILIIFVISNAVALLTNNFSILLLTRIIPAIFHPVFISLAFSVAADSVDEKEAPKAVSRIFIGVSAGMVLGVPVVNYLASNFNLQLALLFFFVVNFAVLILVFIFVPKMPVSSKLTYGKQLNVLKFPLTWISIIVSFLFNAAIFGVYSYFTDFLSSVTNAEGLMVTLILFIYGISNIIGNIIAGHTLTIYPKQTLVVLPFLLIGSFILMFIFGKFSVLMIIISVILGILAGMTANVTQYVITSSAPDAPDLSNGIFLSSVNLGTTVGTFLGGILISILGSNFVVGVGIIISLLNLVFIFTRIHITNKKGAVSNEK
ncbi:TPA: MFS transporter [Staphylococcus aureus]|uniref:MFS transporter n=1 Tax=Staphylococcus aureus TaxID=1280 RepID=UPI001C1ECADB|nr:MFS transporter [Staphylococcus aureus]MBU6885084.1 MFS transporter [Staphylococcus aureus]MBU6898327.1 MFS transporter [Staphylococcus aureus]